MNPPVSYPEAFVEMMNALPGGAEALRAMAVQPSPAAIHINPVKFNTACLPASLRKVAWNQYGFYLNHRPQFTFIPSLYDGHFYVQDPSSMILNHIVASLSEKFDRPIKYLDACAAPGGKTIDALTNLPEGSFVLANEYETSRLGALTENLQRWGLTNYAVSRNDGRLLHKTGPVFDIAAVDAPCSGEGMMRKNTTAITQWSNGLIEGCAALQRQILESVWRAIRPGGYLIYSTCTFNTIENEGNALWIKNILGGTPINLDLDKFPGVQPGINTDIPCARFLPGLVDGEGQFVCVFRKNEDVNVSTEPKFEKLRKTVRLPYSLNGNFTGIDDKQGNIYAVDSNHAMFVNHLSATTNLVIPGLHVATPKGKDYIPAHALATSRSLVNDSFHSHELSYNQAVSFLRGEAFRLSSDTPKGLILMTYNGARLGWMKNIGNRANNLLPAHVRIRSSHIPTEEPTL